MNSLKPCGLVVTVDDTICTTVIWVSVHRLFPMFTTCNLIWYTHCNHTIPDLHNVSHSMSNIIPHLNGVVAIYQQSHTLLRPVIKYEALFSFRDFHLQKRSPIQWCLHAKCMCTPVCVYSHLMITSTCICHVLWTYMLYSPRCHAFGQNKTKQTKKKTTKSCHDLCSDPCIYLFLVSYITSELINSWNMFSYHNCALLKIIFTYKCHIFVWFCTSFYWNWKECYIYLYVVICKIFSELKCPEHMHLRLHMIKNYSAFSKWRNC